MSDESQLVAARLSAAHISTKKVTVNGGDLSTYISQKIDEAVTVIYKFKGSVKTSADLPASDNKNGDVWNVEDTGMNYAWIADSSKWDNLGQTASNMSSTLSDVFQMKGEYVSAVNSYATSNDVSTIFNNKITELDLANTYQEKGSYVSAVNSYATSSEASSLAKVQIDELKNVYQPIGNYLTDVPKEYMTSSQISAFVIGILKQYKLIEDEPEETPYIYASDGQEDSHIHKFQVAELTGDKDNNPQYECMEGETVDMTSIVWLSGDATCECKTLGDYALKNCKNIVSVILPTVDTIGSYAFAGCGTEDAGITVQLSNVDTLDGDSVFQNCYSIRELSLPKVKTIPEKTFYNCSSLVSIDIPKVEAITGGSFMNCVNLSVMVLSSSSVMTKDYVKSNAKSWFTEKETILES